MIKKIKFGSTLTALILFALPWVDIQCSKESMATQSGLQVIYGGASLSDEMKNLEDEAQESDDSGESAGFAPLVLLALLAVSGAAYYSYISLFKGGERAQLLSSVLPAVALVLLLFQLMIGFPVKNKMIEEMSDSSSEVQSDDEFDALGESMAAAMMANIRVKTTPLFYLELLALGIPTLILANGMIDKYRRTEQNVNASP